MLVCLGLAALRCGFMGLYLGLWSGADHIDHEMSYDGHVRRAAALTHAGLILGKDVVDHSVKLVLYASMAAHGGQGEARVSQA